MEVLDEAVALLRGAPLSVLSIYYLGALPFCLGLIYFFSDMSQSVDAESHLAGEALALAALYFWMKTCQAVFARKLLALLEGEDADPWTFPRWINTAVLQAIFAGTLIIIYPVAMVVTVPFGWVNSFYHNISVLGTGAKSSVRSSFAEAAGLAGLWPKQNHLIIGILIIALFVLFLNLAVFFIMLPELLNMLFGLQSLFDENTYAWNNSSFYLDVGVFCFLVLNPLNKAVYALRCFYGRARLSGADLKAELRRYSPMSVEKIAARAGLFLAVLIILGGPARAETAAGPPPAAPAIAPVQPTAVDLNRAIEKTLQKDEFAWRLPRVETTSDPDDDNFLMRLARRLRHEIGHLFRVFADKVDDWLKWMLEKDKNHDSADNVMTLMQSIPWRLITVIFAIVVVGCLLYWLVTLLSRKEKAPVSTLTPAVRTVNLEAEDVRADELPEDSWLSLAQQLIERGELRLGLRALYLATLSVLAQNQLVRLAPFKSNRDYLLELTRRLRGNLSAVEFFRDNVRLFEGSWYGTHDVTVAMLDAMRSNHQQVRQHAAP